MKLRAGFVSNSSSSSFVIKKKYMSAEELKEFYILMEEADFYDTIGETQSYLFGVIDYNSKLFNYVDKKNFEGAEIA
jgi:hypothetical protein